MGILSYIQHDAFRRFMKGSRGPWGPLAVAAFGVRMVVKWSRRGGDVVYRGVLEPGQELHIVHGTETRAEVAKASRRETKAARRRARSGADVVEVAAQGSRTRRGRRGRRDG